MSLKEKVKKLFKLYSMLESLDDKINSNKSTLEEVKISNSKLTKTLIDIKNSITANLDQIRENNKRIEINNDSNNYLFDKVSEILKQFDELNKSRVTKKEFQSQIEDILVDLKATRNDSRKLQDKMNSLQIGLESMDEDISKSLKISNSNSNEIIKLTHRKTVFIFSTMRAGSTLLKALIAEAEDTSYLPEVRIDGLDYAADVLDLSDAPIIVVKDPCWYSQVHSYPKKPELSNSKSILLFRNPYETILSLKKRILEHNNSEKLKTEWYDDQRLLEDYWCTVNENLLSFYEKNSHTSFVVKYESLLEDPISITKDVFKFIGSTQTEGVSTYSKPESYEWEWGVDDASQNIKKLEVLNNKKSKEEDIALYDLTQSSRRVKKIVNKIEKILN